MLSYHPTRSSGPLRTVLALAAGLAAGWGVAEAGGTTPPSQPSPTVCAKITAGYGLVIATGQASCPRGYVKIDTGGAPTFEYKIGDTGPGGGPIFFVDYHDQYPGFTYLEAAPAEIAQQPWCSDSQALIGLNSWAAKAVGQGQANTAAMLNFGCTNSAANAADDYVSPNNTNDWFLPSAGELMLMYTNLLQAGLGNFGDADYWSSSEYDSSRAWRQSFGSGTQGPNEKSDEVRVRAARAF